MTDYIYPPLDSNPTDLYTGFTEYMQTNIPGWQPYSGELDDWLGRAFAFIAAQLTEISSDVATSIFRYFGAFIVNVPPIAAQPAQTLTTWTVQDTAGYTIPAFTQVSFTDATGAQQGFETAVAVAVTPGLSSVTNVQVVATEPGTTGNGCAGAGSNVTLAFVTGVTTLSPTSEGLDDEDDTVYLSRLTTTFQTLSPKPITTNDFSAIALDQPLVGRVTTIPGFNPLNAPLVATTHTSTTIDAIVNPASVPVGAIMSGPGIPLGAFVQSVNVGASSMVISQATTSSLTGTTLTMAGSINNGGYVGSIVGDADGLPLSSPEMAVIQTAIQAQCLAGVVFTATAPTATAVSITATVFAWPGQTQTDVQAAIVAALTAQLTPLQWGLQTSGQIVAGQWLNDNTVRISQVQAIIMQVAGVHYVSSGLLVNGVAADLVLPGIVPIPTPGTMTITVNTG